MGRASSPPCASFCRLRDEKSKGTGTKSIHYRPVGNMYPLVRGISSKFRQFGLGSLFTCRPCGVITEATEYSLRTAYEVLLRNTPTVSAFNVVKLQTGSHLNAGRPLSRILMDVELGVSLFSWYTFLFRLDLSIYKLNLTENFDCCKGLVKLGNIVSCYVSWGD